MTDTVERTYAAPEEYLLLGSKRESRFQNLYAYQRDSIIQAYEARQSGDAYSQESVTRFFDTEAKKIKSFTSDLRVLKDFDTKIRRVILFNTSNRKYLEESLNLKWELLNGQDTIAGLICKKASTFYGGRNYVAWYAPQIPIADGPYVFSGLPGLITKVVDTDKWYIFEISDYKINPQQSFANLPFIAPTYSQKIDRKQYVEHSKEEKYNPKYRKYYKAITPEVLLRLKEKRKTRFDLIIEQQ
jgi:GLPGLI family protein